MYLSTIQSFSAELIILCELLYLKYILRKWQQDGGEGVGLPFRQYGQGLCAVKPPKCSGTYQKEAHADLSSLIYIK